MKERVTGALSEARRLMAEQPRRFSPPRTIDNLIRIGFFKLPNKRSFDDVMQQLEKDDSRATVKRAEILVTLRRRVKGKKLQGEKGPDGWIFWAP